MDLDVTVRAFGSTSPFTLIETPESGEPSGAVILPIISPTWAAYAFIPDRSEANSKEDRKEFFIMFPIVRYETLLLL
ncbi:MAG: hypothetical protein NWQ54_18855 [Paraglaciecola sp.]|nr:hypothetical protein [Paraglaciecola sp.]